MATRAGDESGLSLCGSGRIQLPMASGNNGCSDSSTALNGQMTGIHCHQIALDLTALDLPVPYFLAYKFETVRPPLRADIRVSRGRALTANGLCPCGAQQSVLIVVRTMTTFVNSVCLINHLARLAVQHPPFARPHAGQRACSGCSTST